MNTMQQLRNAHHNLVFKSGERVSHQSFKAFVREASTRDGKDYMAIVKKAHKDAHKPRSEAKATRTRLATAARRMAGSKKTTTVVATK